MSSLSSTIEAIDATLTKIQSVHVGSVAFVNYSQKVHELVQRRTLLSTYTEEMAAHIEVVNAEVDKKIDDLEGERKERIANIIHEYEEKASKLPVIADVEIIVEKEAEPEKLPEVTCTTVQTVKMYAKKYFDDYNEQVPVVNNFFHAAACSFCQKYQTKFHETQIEEKASFLLSVAKLPTDTQNALSLADIDSILHSDRNSWFRFVVLDTSLCVIWTNFPEVFQDYQSYALIFDSESKLFAPVSVWSAGCARICFKCMRYKPIDHECQRHCPICLRIGNVSRCSKPSPKSKPNICSKCNAFCQTKECYTAHCQVCPRPVQGIHDDVLQIIQSLKF